MATEIRYYSLPIPTPVDRIADTCENITFQHFTGQLNPCHLLLLPLPTSGEGYVFTHVSRGPGFPHLSTNPPTTQPPDMRTQHTGPPTSDI